jgi:hypothetical protein
MRLFKVAVSLLTLLLGLTAVNAQVNAELPQFKSGASLTMGVPVDFNIFSQRVGAIYDVVESDDSHIVWKFTGSTGDWAFVFTDGRIAVASNANFDLAAKDTLAKELNDVIDLINVLTAGITDEIRSNALNSRIYYATDPEIYHRIKYDYNSDLNDFTLVVPNCTVNNARLVVTGCDPAQCDQDKTPAQAYYIDGNEVASCSPPTGHQWCDDCCNMEAADITNNILTPGKHKISSRYVGAAHTIILEVLTSPSPPKNFVLYGPNFIPWINETTKSLTIEDMNLFITGSLNRTPSEDSNKPALQENDIWGKVVEDADGNGNIDPGETGIPGLIVYLTPINGTKLEKTLTNTDGEFSFSSKPSGPYLLAIGYSDEWITFPMKGANSSIIRSWATTFGDSQVQLNSGMNINNLFDRPPYNFVACRASEASEYIIKREAARSLNSSNAQ